jgi:Tfp pilus assembly protein PilF
MINTLKETAFQALSRNDLAKAVSLYNKILELDPDDHTANHIIAT